MSRDIARVSPSKRVEYCVKTVICKRFVVLGAKWWARALDFDFAALCTSADHGSARASG
jgi:hypothetical protein